MSHELPPLPAEWTPRHSIAYLFLGVGIADGTLDQIEADTSLSILARHESVSEDEAKEVLIEAHGHLDAVNEAGGREAWFRTLDAHFALLANRLGKPTLRTIIQDMIAIALSDGHLASEEVMLIQAAASRWGVGGEA